MAFQPETGAGSVRGVAAAVSMVLGYEAGESDKLLNDYLRTTRHAHAVVERVFWG